MSLPQSSPLNDIIKNKWQRLAGLARIVWDDLTLDELIRSKGDLDKLTPLIQQRYGMTQEEAQKQILSFFERHRTT